MLQQSETLLRPPGIHHLCIADSSLRDRFGHHYHYEEALVEAARRSGWTVELHANKTCEEDICRILQAQQTFKFAVEDVIITTRFVRGLGNFVLLNYYFFVALIARLRSRNSSLVFFHMINENQLLGIAVWYRLLWYKRFRAVVLLHFDLGRADAVGRKLTILRVILHKISILPVKRFLGKRFHLVADNRALAERYEMMLKCSVGILPHPFSGQPPVDVGYVARDTPILVALGEPRMSKGFDVLVGAIEDLLCTETDCIFKVQISGGTDETGCVRAIDKLRELSSDKRVILIEHQLSESDYAETLAGCDGVMLPYDPASYSDRTSGIFSEAISLGKPVVTVAGTWLAGEMASLGMPGVISPSWTREGVANAIAELVSNLGDLSASAHRAAETWASVNGADNFLAKLQELGSEGGRDVARATA